MKFLIICLLSLPMMGFTKEKIERKTANAERVVYTMGNSLSYRLPAQTDVRLIVISGDSARAVWQTLSAQQYSLGKDNDGAETFQKVGENITCERVHQRADNKHEYTCSIAIKADGKALPGAAG